MFPRRQAGSSLSEYGIIVAVVAVGAIGCLLFMKGQFSKMLVRNADVLNIGTQTVSNKRSELNKLLAAGKPKPPEKPKPAPTNPPPPPAPPKPKTLDGYPVTIGAQEIKLPTTPSFTETSGVNGNSQSTLAILSTLDQLVIDLEKAQAPQDLIDRVRNLANAGHALADSQSVLEASCKPNSPCSIGVDNQFTAINSKEVAFQQNWQTLEKFMRSNSQ